MGKARSALTFSIGIRSADFGRAGAVCLGLWLAVGSLYGQGGYKEYIRLGGRVIAIENQNLAITTAAALPSATLGQQYSVTLAATGGEPNYTWGLGSGLAFAYWFEP